MAKIHVLDSETIDKIAAGEVVERPASVVKELVENAIDAGATAITVEAKEGGIEFLRITDNGSGMEAEQIRTAFLRHATSKIKNADDLMNISSLGFRGEALSSIAAVSKVEVITRTQDALMGIRYMCEGAVETGIEEVGAPVGTTFIVRNLFYNTPVRKKFLKQPATEGGYIADLMEHMALSRPDISFKFQLNQQLKFHTSGNGDLREVIYRIYGREVAGAMVPIQVTRNGITVEGYLGKPVLVRSNRNFEIYYINGRFIRSQVIAKALEEGYREYLMQHKFPFCVLHITMDHGKVDVNVHPTKMDVRFSDTPLFCSTLAGVVKETLKGREMIPQVSVENVKTQKDEGNRERKTPEPYETVRTNQYRVMEEVKFRAKQPEMKDMIKQPVWNRVLGEKKIRTMQEAVKKAETVGEQAASRNDCTFFGEKEDDFYVESNTNTKNHVTEAGEINRNDVNNADEQKTEEVKARKEENVIEEYGKEENNKEENNAVPVREENGKQLNLFDEKILTEEKRAKFRVIGQAFLTYWMVETEDKLLIIDQHAAHEKVKYERLMKHCREKQIISQEIFPPAIVSVTGKEKVVLEMHKEKFQELGFEFETFGGNEIALRSVPAELYGCDEKQMFLEVLNELTEGNSGGNLKAVEEKIASMSCKAAVKGNQRMSAAEAEALIDELLTLENPYHCPHGRPTVISMSRTEIEKKFKRIVD